MAFNAARVGNYIRNFEFPKLFREELGWDIFRNALRVPLDDINYGFVGIAEKGGLQVFECVVPADREFPDHPTRVRLERQVAKTAAENLLVFTDEGRTRQTWQWVYREPGKPRRCRVETFTKGQSGERLAQKLQRLEFTLEEEDRQKPTIVDARGRVRQAFDVEKVTKKFYERFKREHDRFLNFIVGIVSVTDRAWYASLMLNRLMFVYFIQKKRFLNDDPDYLRNKLDEVQRQRGKGKFLSFYRHFLRKLFHDGLGKKERSPALDKLLGNVPYLNGGLFEVHDLEQSYPDLDVPDEAFEQLFAFFDEYNWHLDERPLSSDKEINPDVLGYIFEKYINQKQMGAYYTKEDITGYIARNTVLPFVLDKARERCAIAFDPGGVAWTLLRDDPDRYIYEPVRRGVGTEPPEAIAAGLTDVSQRGGWNRSVGDDAIALPTETWREFAARWQRCTDLRAKLRAGEVTQVNDLITYNLDIRQFAEDLIVSCEGPELLRAVYEAATTVSVLDPTCGSGAFLFAALNVLEPLYDACLDRMQAFLDDAERLGDGAAKYEDFRGILNQVGQHPSRRYFILKSIAVNNLYGVDIMDEAVEICKLRLFLKLVAQVDKASQLEPLPDIDFNVRAGNTLVGFATLAEAKKGADLNSLGELAEVERAAGELDMKFRVFRQQQTALTGGALVVPWDKADLRARLRELRDTLDRYLAGSRSRS